VAIVPSRVGHAGPNLDDIAERLRACVSNRANAVIAVSVPALIVSVLWMFLDGRAGLDHRAAIDYQVYRWAVHTWLAGGDIINGALTTEVGPVLPWVYPPFALSVLAPLSLVPFVVGLVLLYAVDLVTIGVVAYLVVRRMWPVVDKRVAVAVTAAVLPCTLFLEPVYSAFGLGQINIVLMGLVAVDCLARETRWPRGLLVGVAAAIKLTPAAFLLFFLVRKDFRAAMTTAITAAAGTVIGFVLNFRASMDYWFGQGPATGVSGSSFHTNQSIMGELSRLELPALARTGVWAMLGVVLLVVVAKALRWVEAPLALTANALLALLISPTSWSDHWVWVVPGLLVMSAYALRQRSRGWLAAAAVTTLVTLIAPFDLVPAAELVFTWTPLQHLVGNSYLLLGIALLLLFGRYAARARIEDREPEDHLPALAASLPK
jgi:alpha-1,2-mannosyltransferase